MSFSPTITDASTAVPGVRFTVHRIGFGRRAEIDRKTVALRQRLRELELDTPTQSPREKEISRQLEVATQKAQAISVAVTVGEATDADFERALHEDIEPIAQQLAEAAPLDVQKRRAAINEEYAAVQAQIHCVWIRFGFVSIEHKGEDGTPGDLDAMTVDQLLDYGPQALGREIFDAIASSGRLADKKLEAVKSPGTSGAAVPTPTNNTTAPVAEPPDGTRSETVSAITP